MSSIQEQVKDELRPLGYSNDYDISDLIDEAAAASIKLVLFAILALPEIQDETGGITHRARIRNNLRSSLRAAIERMMQ